MRNIMLVSANAMLALAFPGLCASADDVISLNQPRPLMILSSELAKRYGYLVTYEDAPPDGSRGEVRVEHRAKGQDYCYPEWKPVVFHVHAQKAATEGLDGNAIRVTENSSNAERQDSVKPLGPDIIDSLMSEYNVSGNPGKFTVIYDGEYAHIVPSGRSVNGRYMDFEPILSTTVLINQPEGSCNDVLKSLFDEVQKIRGVRILPANEPFNQLMTRQCSIRGHDLPARQALIQVLDELGDNSEFPTAPNYRGAWTLVYEPTTESYFLSMLFVPRPRRDAARPGKAAVQTQTDPGEVKGPNLYVAPKAGQPKKKR